MRDLLSAGKLYSAAEDKADYEDEKRDLHGVYQRAGEDVVVVAVAVAADVLVVGLLVVFVQHFQYDVNYKADYQRDDYFYHDKLPKRRREFRVRDKHRYSFVAGGDVYRNKRARAYQPPRVEI